MELQAREQKQQHTAAQQQQTEASPHAPTRIGSPARGPAFRASGVPNGKPRGKPRRGGAVRSRRPRDRRRRGTVAQKSRALEQLAQQSRLEERSRTLDGHSVAQVREAEKPWRCRFTFDQRACRWMCDCKGSQTERSCDRLSEDTRSLHGWNDGSLFELSCGGPKTGPSLGAGGPERDARQLGAQAGRDERNETGRQPRKVRRSFICQRHIEVKIADGRKHRQQRSEGDASAATSKAQIAMNLN